MTADPDEIRALVESTAPGRRWASTPEGRQILDLVAQAIGRNEASLAARAAWLAGLAAGLAAGAELSQEIDSALEHAVSDREASPEAARRLRSLRARLGHRKRRMADLDRAVVVGDEVWIPGRSGERRSPYVRLYLAFEKAGQPKDRRAFVRQFFAANPPVDADSPNFDIEDATNKALKALRGKYGRMSRT